MEQHRKIDGHIIPKGQNFIDASYTSIMLDDLSHKRTLSVVLPVFNGEKWIEGTVLAVVASISNSDWNLNEFVCVDDGSTDKTNQILKEIQAKLREIPIVTIKQANLGRYLARANGITVTTSEFVLLLDSRVRIYPDSLRNAFQIVDKNDGITSHVEYSQDNTLFGMFWSAAEVIFWNEYWKEPREILLTEENFDLVPKGTTCFLCRKEILANAMKMFSPIVSNIKNSSDDTELIRQLIKIGSVIITPEFRATYFARNTFLGTLRHAFYRGVMFADGHVFRKSKLLIKLVSSATVIGVLGIVYLLTIANIYNFLGVMILGNVILAIRFTKLRWRRIVSLNLFIVPIFLTWFLGVFKGIIEKNRSIE